MTATVSQAKHSKVLFMPDDLPAATLPISGLEDHLRICWPAYPEARLEFYSIGFY